jgi:hypothetical protein
VEYLDSMLKDEVDINSPLNSDADEDSDFEDPAPAAEAPAADAPRRSTCIRERDEQRAKQAEEMSRAEQRQHERVRRQGYGHAMAVLQEVLHEPVNLQEAKRCPQWPQWREAIEKEIRALESNDTFELVDKPTDATVHGYTIQFRIKHDGNGEPVYKARVCARGDHEVFEMHYLETYAPVAGLDTVRVFFTFVVKNEMQMLQGDVPSAYAKAKLNDRIFMRQIRGFEREVGKVYRLRNALYGLKQAGREWHSEIHEYLLSLGLIATQGDECLYYQRLINGILLVLLYVDDVLVAHHEMSECEALMAKLHRKYEIKVLGVSQEFLGMSINRPSLNELHIAQPTYIDEVLHRFALQDAKPSLLPMIANTRLDLTGDADKLELDEMRTVPYRQAVGALTYVQRVSRPDQ